MKYLSRTFAMTALYLPAVFVSSAAHAATPSQMMQECRVRAGQIFRTRLPNVDTKYEGQRTDGTHAVNGTATFDNRTETFQCSFNRSGRKIIQFVVNEPNAGAGSSGDHENSADGHPTTSDPVTRAKSDCIKAVAKQVGGGQQPSVIDIKPGENFFTVRVHVPRAQAPWICEHSSREVLRVYYGAEG